MKSRFLFALAFLYAFVSRSNHIEVANNLKIQLDALMQSDSIQTITATPEDFYDYHVTGQLASGKLFLLQVGSAGCSSGTVFHYYLRNDSVILITESNSSYEEDENNPQSDSSKYYISNGELTAVEFSNSNSDTASVVNNGKINLANYRDYLAILKNSREWKMHRQFSNLGDLPVKKVNTFENLLQETNSGYVSFEIDTGMYNLSKLDTSQSNEHYRWSHYLEGTDYGWDKSTVTFSNMQTIELKGIGNLPEDTKIYSENSQAIVLVFENCKNVVIENLWLGHITPSQSCEGGVLSFINCENITINNTQMFGTGFYGFEVYGGKKIKMSNSEIWDCSGGAFHVYGCDSTLINKSSIHDNVSAAFYSWLSNTYAIIDSSSWTNNKMEDSAVENQALFNLQNSTLLLSNSAFSGNNTEAFVNKDETGHLFESDNTFEIGQFTKGFEIGPKK